MVMAEQASALRQSRNRLFADELTAERRWYVLRTRTRQEKVVARELANRDVLHFLPLVKATRYYAGRKALVDLPLFPGYVFLRGCSSDAYSLDRAGRLAQIIEIRDQQQVHAELKNIDYALSREAGLSLFPYLRKGIRVEVRTGPLKGLQGIIEDINRRDRIVLQVETLDQSVSAELDGSLLEVID